MAANGLPGQAEGVLRGSMCAAPRRLFALNPSSCGRGCAVNLVSATTDMLPRQARDMIPDVEGTLCITARGWAFGSAFEQAGILVSLPTAVIRGMDANAMGAALHLRDEPPESDGYQPAWNGVLRLFNLVQFLSKPWRSTTAGVGE